MSEQFDVIVVGAGPAGSAAALTAAAEGLSVLLLEEHERIGTPLACAEGLSRSTIQGYLEVKDEWISARLHGAIVRGPQHDEFRIDYPDVGWVLDRKVFDPALAEMARGKGAVLKTGCRAVGVEGNRLLVKQAEIVTPYSFRLLVGADGIASNVGQWMGLETRLRMSEVEVCAEYRLANLHLDPQSVHLIFGENYAPGGYAWVFPKGPNSANVGLGISPLRTRTRALAFLDGWTRREFPGAQIEERIFGGVPAKVLDRISTDRCLLVGDAARLCDPLSGAGIANGVKSGVIAGHCAAQRLRGEKDHFEAEIERAIRSEVRFHKKVRDAYLGLGDRDYDRVYRVGKRLFEGRRIDDINTRHIVRTAIMSNPRLWRLAFRILF